MKKPVFLKVRFSPDPPDGVIKCVGCVDAEGQEGIMRAGSIGELVPGTEGEMEEVPGGSVEIGPFYEFKEFTPPWKMGAIADQGYNFDVWLEDAKHPNGGHWIDQGAYFESIGLDPWGNEKKPQA